jgi:Polyketide cyclase / dehydrase and lipid transport
VEVTAPAAPTAVWAILADVTRVGEWSHECHTAQWLDGATAAAPGARFRGRNRSGRVNWARACTITVSDPPRELIYHTSGGFFGDSSEWRFALEPADGGGTVIRQSFRVLAGKVWADRLIWRLVPAHHDRLAALRGDLTRLAALAAGQPAPAPV